MKGERACYLGETKREMTTIPPKEVAVWSLRASPLGDESDLPVEEHQISSNFNKFHANLMMTCAGLEERLKPSSCYLREASSFGHSVTMDRMSCTGSFVGQRWRKHVVRPGGVATYKRVLHGSSQSRSVSPCVALCSIV
jgi:hypothetical protein